MSTNSTRHKSRNGETHSEEEVVVLSYSYKAFRENYVGKNGEKFTVILNKVLKPNTIITIDKDYGDYLLVEEVNGHKHTLSLIGSDGDENLEYPVEFLKNNPTYYVVSDSVITKLNLKKVSKQKVKDDFVHNIYLSDIGIYYQAENNKEEKQNDNFNPETKNCSYTMCGRVECKHCSSNEDFRKTNEAFKRNREERLKSRLDKEIIFLNQELPKYFVEGFNKAQKNIVKDEKPVRVNFYNLDMTGFKPLTFDSLSKATKFFQNSTFGRAFYYDFKTNEKLLEEVKPEYIERVGWQMRRGREIKYGEKANKNKPQLSLLFKQFPQALEAIVKCSEYGHKKYRDSDEDYLNYQRVEGGSKTYADASLRHRLEQGNDLESGLPHQYHVAWNALAELQLWLMEKNSTNFKNNLQD